MERFEYLFYRYCDKTANVEERLEFQEFLQSEKYSIELQDLLYEYFSNFEKDQPSSSIYTADESFRAVMAAVKFNENANADISQGAMVFSNESTIQPVIKRKLQPAFWAIAASIIMFFAFGIYFLSSTSKKSQGHQNAIAQSNQQQIFINPSGKKMNFKLSDGTKVILNGNSSLRLDADYSNSRTVTLTGEAYFDVVHNANKPFTVHTSKIDVVDLGTVFNIKAYANDRNTEATLVSGAIRINLHDVKNDYILLKPKEKFVLQTAKPNVARDGALEVKTKPEFRVVDLTKNTSGSSLAETDWIKGKLTFDNKPLEEIATELERWYNVKVIFKNNSAKTIRYNLSFDHEPIEDVIDALTLSGNFKCRKEGDLIIFY